jgi:hypothetical protein
VILAPVPSTVTNEGARVRGTRAVRLGLRLR